MKNFSSTASLPRDPTVSIQSTTSRNSSSVYPSLFHLQSYAESSVDTTLQLPYTEKSDAESSYELCKRVRSVSAMLGIASIVAVIFVLSFYLPDGNKNDAKVYANHELGLMNFNVSSLSAIVTNNDGEPALKVQMGSTVAPEVMLSGRERFGSSEIFHFDVDRFRLNLTVIPSPLNSRCWHVAWSGYHKRNFVNCFEMAPVHWYGGAELYNQAWPLEKASVEMTPFLTSDLLSKSGKKNAKYGGVLEPWFINSKGAGLYVDEDVDLHVSINEAASNKLCFKASQSGYPPSNSGHSSPLGYTVCAAENVKSIRSVMRKMFIPLPHAAPSADVIATPIWSTWAKFKANVTQENVTSYANDIRRHNFTASQIEIDDRYSTAYGDFNFDIMKFPNATAMVEGIHAHGFAVTVWVYPFANVYSKAFGEGVNYWVGNKQGIPQMVRWWNGLGALLDVTNPLSTAWFYSRLASFRDRYNIDAFKFDAGEVEYLPKTNFEFAVPQPNENYFSKLYAELAGRFGNRVETRVGYKTQHLPIFTRLLDRSSTWGQQNGLKSVITATMTLGILGYPYVLPDMIGGNAYVGYPDKELYIRWMQVNAFMPSAQFSIAPWDYDNDMVELARQALSVRQYLMPYILSLAQAAPSTGEPIVRPLWWHAPNDDYCQTADTEFMLGNTYLVAPVLEKGQNIKSVYLPVGNWLEMFAPHQTHFVSTKGMFLRYNVTLSDIPYFKLL